MLETLASRRPSSSLATITTMSASLSGRPPTFQLRVLPSASGSDGSPRNAERLASPFVNAASPNCAASAGDRSRATAGAETATLTHVTGPGSVEPDALAALNARLKASTSSVLESCGPSVFLSQCLALVRSVPEGPMRRNRNVWKSLLNPARMLP